MMSLKTLIWASLALTFTAVTPSLAQDASGRDDAGADRAEDSEGFPRLRLRDEARDFGRAVLQSGGPGTQGPPIPDLELDLVCGEAGWIGTWLEDEDGNPIANTYDYYCLNDGD